jgi:hypothetical protein
MATEQDTKYRQKYATVWRKAAKFLELAGNNRTRAGGVNFRIRGWNVFDSSITSKQKPRWAEALGRET